MKRSRSDQPPIPQGPILDLLPSQRAQAADQLVAAGLQPADFEWRLVPNGLGGDAQVPCLALIGDTGFQFIFGRRDAGYRYVATRRPGANWSLEDFINSTDWEGQLVDFAEWVQFLVRELVAQDPWQSLESVREFAGFADRQNDNTPFTDGERMSILSRLDDLQRHIQTNIDLSIEQRVFVARQVDYLRDASRRLGRKDWLMLALGVISNVAVGVALSASQISPILERILNGVRAILA